MTETAILLKIMKFGMVGISGLVIDFGLTSFLKELLTIRKYLSNSIGFIAAATSNFILNRIWTFNSTSPDVAVQALKFFIIAIIGLAINSAIIYFFTDSKFRINFYASKGIATFAVFFWNFTMNYFLTF